eukprot:TRINITY_DN19574_c0_g1_i2.p3 TRINITY_DN19574_c0_g1~~TRINITY_DN19574_c0_g1_i2.p3  ORF type:complete len:115 (+),score=1.63 TRINITY_DN19574_c0_g1_i2:353-697(+)
MKRRANAEPTSAGSALPTAANCHSTIMLGQHNVIHEHFLPHTTQKPREQRASRRGPSQLFKGLADASSAKPFIARRRPPSTDQSQTWQRAESSPRNSNPRGVYKENCASSVLPR